MQPCLQRFAEFLFHSGVAVAVGVTISSAELISRDRVQLGFQTMQQIKVGILTGQVTRGPISPLETGNESSTLPAGGVQIRLARLNGQPVETVLTNFHGHYEIALPEGRYLVTLPQPLSGSMVTKDLPSEVQIQSDHRTRLDIRLDTGIR